MEGIDRTDQCRRCVSISIESGVPSSSTGPVPSPLFLSSCPAYSMIAVMVILHCPQLPGRFVRLHNKPESIETDILHYTWDTIHVSPAGIVNIECVRSFAMRWTPTESDMALARRREPPSDGRKEGFRVPRKSSKVSRSSD